MLIEWEHFLSFGPAQCCEKWSAALSIIIALAVYVLIEKNKREKKVFKIMKHDDFPAGKQSSLVERL